jgi:hypothetical protein
VREGDHGGRTAAAGQLVGTGDEEIALQVVADLGQRTLTALALQIGQPLL